jgi:hypothetical protein
MGIGAGLTEQAPDCRAARRGSLEGDPLVRIAQCLMF